MPLPRTLTNSALVDLDLELTAGAWPADLAGEMVISAPEPNEHLDYALFGFGAGLLFALASYGLADWQVPIKELVRGTLWRLFVLSVFAPIGAIIAEVCLPEPQGGRTVAASGEGTGQ